MDWSGFRRTRWAHGSHRGSRRGRLRGSRGGLRHTGRSGRLRRGGRSRSRGCRCRRSRTWRGRSSSRRRLDGRCRRSRRRRARRRGYGSSGLSGRRRYPPWRSSWRFHDARRRVLDEDPVVRIYFLSHATVGDRSKKRTGRRMLDQQAWAHARNRANELRRVIQGISGGGCDTSEPDPWLNLRRSRLKRRGPSGCP